MRSWDWSVFPFVHEKHSSDYSSKILVPLVEKLAEHLTAVDEAHDNQVRPRKAGKTDYV